jgi:hypothetical protein
MKGGVETVRRWRVTFIVRKLETKWCVLERLDSGVGLISYWSTREQAREAARQLNQEERRYA